MPASTRTLTARNEPAGVVLTLTTPTIPGKYATNQAGQHQAEQGICQSDKKGGDGDHGKDDSGVHECFGDTQPGHIRGLQDVLDFGQDNRLFHLLIPPLSEPCGHHGNEQNQSRDDDGGDSNKLVQFQVVVVTPAGHVTLPDSCRRIPKA